MKRLSHIKLFALALVGSLALFSAPAGAINVIGDACTANPGSAICQNSGETVSNTMIQNIVNLLLFVLGVIAVIMIIIGGIKYTTSDGDSSKIKSAKDTILYSVVGLVVAVLAFAIVNFVLQWFL